MKLEQLPLFRLPPVAPAPKTHRILLGGRVVEYTLRPAKSRLTLHIDERGLRVGQPRRIGIADVEAFIRLHAAWVCEKLDEHTQRSVRRQISIRDGIELPVLGTDITVRVAPPRTQGHNRSAWFDRLLELSARHDADLDALARRAMQQRALAHFGDRLAHFLSLAGIATLPRLGLSSARTRWGSCSHTSGIRLNWRLIHLPTALVDYVIVHEICHLKEMNHSPRFWAEVESLCPDWRALRAELKYQGSRIPLL
jgi:predicted metal-dependent hydrolase